MKKLITLALVAFTSVSANAQLPNPGMENWRNLTSEGVSLEAPNGWYGSDSLAIWAANYYFFGLSNLSQQLFKESAIKNSGNFSAKVETHEDQLAGIIPGIMANAQPTIDTATFDITDPFGSIGYQGGTPVTERIYFVNAMVRYETPDVVGDEYGLMSVQAVLSGQGFNGGDSIVGIGSTQITETAGSGFEAISAMVTYNNANVVPDKIIVFFQSSGDISSGVDGSTLYIDDVSLSNLSVKNPVAGHTIKCFPNPTQGMLNVRSATHEALRLNVFTLTGQQVYTQGFETTIQADLSAFSSGIYFYTVSNAAGDNLVQDKLIINK